MAIVNSFEDWVNSFNAPEDGELKSSLYPLLGLVHKVTLYKYEVQTDFMGHKTRNTEEAVQTIAIDVNCRISKYVNNETEEKMLAGFDRQHLWQIVFEYNSLITENLLFRRNSNSSILPEGEYKLVMVLPRIDESGNYHHITAYAEKQ